ncbi:unnamed protein product [Durusdinium trenchii]|uniref:YTH domain-containing protein n=1 Tax=Durusdinium trenchii TaxID=1381693 RepID=A0ABP0RD56_9DINO
MLREPAGFKRSPLLQDPRARFFVITSNVGENVVKSVENNVWATQRRNEQMLADAFRTTRVVILIFSVSKSGAFQGYARMRSLPGQSKCKSDPFGGFGRLFDVEWLRLQDVVMPEVSYLRNPLDEGRQVTAARDGQELSYQVGAELCTHFDVRVYLEDPKNYEPCMDELLPASVPRDAFAPHGGHFAPAPIPGPPPAVAPPWMAPYGSSSPFEPSAAWFAPSTAAPTAPPGAWVGSTSGERPSMAPGSSSPFEPSGPTAPPGAWVGSTSGERQSRSRSGPSPVPVPVPAAAVPAVRERTRRRSRQDTPDFTKMTFQEYVEWWKKTHPNMPVNGVPAAAVPVVPATAPSEQTSALAEAPTVAAPTGTAKADNGEKAAAVPRPAAANGAAGAESSKKKRKEKDEAKGDKKSKKRKKESAAATTPAEARRECNEPAECWRNSRMN